MPLIQQVHGELHHNAGDYVQCYQLRKWRDLPCQGEKHTADHMRQPSEIKHPSKTQQMLGRGGSPCSCYPNADVELLRDEAAVLLTHRSVVLCRAAVLDNL
eukprot:1130453-Pleurochrysis_carterae.AAC.3